MENEIKSIVEKNDINVVKINSEYEEGIYWLYRFELEDKVLRLTGDDNETPCIDVLGAVDKKYTSNKSLCKSLFTESIEFLIGSKFS